MGAKSKCCRRYRRKSEACRRCPLMDMLSRKLGAKKSYKLSKKERRKKLDRLECKA